MIPIKDALSLMIQFASLVVAMIVAIVTVTRKK
ncbi:putative holin-like toxin [Heyndrickxia acidicola]|uniref:Holin-like toxin n=1 Tax=Heyndrickxia acidicola TaxID=209389 RepID=A0ABU6MFX1_9BACI|nr:putative holin-like toxin [Heyndrickxia acidicola]MED1203590.1 putative holin-like toxin [Heyndrickxia acidicola]